VFVVPAVPELQFQQCSSTTSTSSTCTSITNQLLLTHLLQHKLKVILKLNLLYLLHPVLLLVGVLTFSPTAPDPPPPPPPKLALQNYLLHQHFLVVD
jgi:hypothetical protein